MYGNFFSFWRWNLPEVWSGKKQHALVWLLICVKRSPRWLPSNSLQLQISYGSILTCLDGPLSNGSCQIFVQHHRQCRRVLKDIDVHKAAVAAMFQTLWHPPWGSCNIKLATKLWIYRTTVYQFCCMEVKYGCWQRLKSTSLTFLILINFSNGRRRSEMKIFIAKPSNWYHQRCSVPAAFLVWTCYKNERPMNPKVCAPRNATAWPAITWAPKA